MPLSYNTICNEEADVDDYEGGPACDESLRRGVIKRSIVAARAG